jgi:hypothetical protein
MNRSTTLMAAFLGVLSLSACERETVVSPAPPPVITNEPTGAVPVPVPVPAPVPVPGPAGPPGEPGAPGQPGTPGDTNVTITPPAASAPSQ